MSDEPHIGQTMRINLRTGEYTLKPDAPSELAEPSGSAYFRLFEYMSRNHGLTLTDSELADICNCVEAMLHDARNKAQPAAPNDKGER